VQTKRKQKKTKRNKKKQKERKQKEKKKSHRECRRRRGVAVIARRAEVSAQLPLEV
jgi:hypothetical protein